VCQWDDLALGLKTSVGDTLQDLLNSPQAILDLIRAIESGQLSLKDLGQALGSGLEPLKYIAQNWNRVWIGNPTDLEVYEYGRNLGSVIQAVAGGAGGAAAAKMVSKAAPRLAKVLRSTENVAPEGPSNLAKETRVIAHHPEYINLSKELGVRPFDIPTNAWNKMTPTEQWAANQKFLDRAIAKEAEFVLATPLKEMRKGTFFEKEVKYLMSKGYKLSSDGSKLIKQGR